MRRLKKENFLPTYNRDLFLALLIIKLWRYLVLGEVISVGF